MLESKDGALNDGTPRNRLLPATTSVSGSRILLEVCVESLQSALSAEQGGAHRLELCSNLAEGGTTPSYGLIKVVVAAVGLPVYVLIRPRGGNFLVSQDELKVMAEDIRAVKAAGAKGVVIGILTAEGDVDFAKMSSLLRVCSELDLDTTFHRAFDHTRDPMQAMENIISLGMRRILTSGQQSSMFEGAVMIASLVAAARGRISIMPGGGLSRGCAAKIVHYTGVHEIHGSCRRRECPQQTYKNPKCSLRQTRMLNEDEVSMTDSEEVQEILKAVAMLAT